jgi:ubiquinone/menaquinone biosynthesis C-methylase UbiE
MRTQRALAHSGITLHPVILDRAPAHLGGIHPGVCGDALALPFRDSSFDAVGCSLFLHHLEPEEIIRFAREGLRVARHAFLIQDLLRHPVHLALSYLGLPLYRSRITRHDALASVRRAYTAEEVRNMLEHVAAKNDIEIRKYYLFRMGVIVWKQPNMT